MDLETVQSLISQGVAVAIVAALGWGVAHYWLKHGLPTKIKKDEADLVLKERLGNSVESLAISHSKSVQLMETIDNRVGKVEADVGAIKGWIEKESQEVRR